MAQQFLSAEEEFSEEARHSHKRAMEEKRRELARYHTVSLEQAGKRERNLMQPVLDDLNSLIKEFGRDRGCDIVFGTLTGGNVLYATPELDLTDEFLEFAHSRR